MNVYAMADGLPVWCNLMLAVMDDRHELCERAEAYEPAHCEVHGEVPQMMYDLPTSVEIEGYGVRDPLGLPRGTGHLRGALGPVPLGRGPGACDTRYLYPGFADMPPEHYQEAIRQCFWFINCGNEEENRQKAPRLVDWEQDFPYIVAPVNRVCGQEIRAVPYMHWWTFGATITRSAATVRSRRSYTSGTSWRVASRLTNPNACGTAKTGGLWISKPRIPTRKNNFLKDWAKIPLRRDMTEGARLVEYVTVG